MEGTFNQMNKFFFYQIMGKCGIKSSKIIRGQTSKIVQTKQINEKISKYKVDR